MSASVCLCERVGVLHGSELYMLRRVWMASGQMWVAGIFKDADVRDLRLRLVMCVCVVCGRSSRVMNK